MNSSEDVAGLTARISNFQLENVSISKHIINSIMFVNLSKGEIVIAAINESEDIVVDVAEGNEVYLTNTIPSVGN
ncbi:MAG: hypothetical protein HUJ51_04270 [Eggerthellaceae bacterium]|nr:hypothetical protein [Eggerthellaceae bacterium]